MKNKAQIAFTEEWLMAVLEKYVELPKDFEVLHLDRDVHGGRYYLVAASETFEPTAEGAPYRRIAVAGNATITSHTPEREIVEYAH